MATRVASCVSRSSGASLSSLSTSALRILIAASSSAIAVASGEVSFLISSTSSEQRATKATATGTAALSSAAE
eukprot:494810-Prymnesium_polylepis.1